MLSWRSHSTPRRLPAGGGLDARCRLLHSAARSAWLGCLPARNRVSEKFRITSPL
jgi:hypothetical protein